VPKIAGTATHTKRLRDGVGPNGIAVLGKYLYGAGERVQVDAQVSITEGAVSGAGHVPSRPGEPPNNDTGVLANNIETVQVETLKVVVSSNAEYASFQEFGTSRMQPRPYMAPALEKNRKYITQAILTGINRANKTEG
jgi:HK97 gp10 family phage protein